MTQRLFEADAYQRDCEAVVTGVTRGGIILDRTLFYARGGGQPGDTGALLGLGDETLEITDCVKAPCGDAKGALLHVRAVVLEEASPSR